MSLRSRGSNWIGRYEMVSVSGRAFSRIGIVSDPAHEFGRPPYDAAALIASARGVESSVANSFQRSECTVPT
eukprot:5680404-Amphidinium_carterae.1